MVLAGNGVFHDSVTIDCKPPVMEVYNLCCSTVLHVLDGRVMQ